MNLQPHEERDDLKVWLDADEVEQLIAAADTREQRLAFILGARCGLRSHEIITVTGADVVQSTCGPRVRVWEGKGGKFRETPAPDELLEAITYRDAPPADKLVPRDSTRTIQRWVKGTGALLAEETGDSGWRHLTPHDLRRTWATLLRAAGVDPMLVMDWGGWEDIETFMEHYRGTYSPAVQRREVSKVDWLDASEPPQTADVEEPRVSILE